MTSITLNFTDDQFEKIQEMARQKQFSDPERYLESLVETSLKVEEIGDLEQKLRDGFESELSDWTSEDLEDIRREGKKLMEKRKAV